MNTLLVLMFLSDFVCPLGLLINCIFFSASRVNPWSHSAGSFTSPLRPQIKGSRLLLLLQTCASRPPSLTPLSPRPKRATLKVEGTWTAGATPAWAAPPRPRVARPATPSPDRSSPPGTCRRCSGPRALSSLPSSWASNQGRTAPPSPEPHAPESPTSMTWRKLRCNFLPSNSTSKKCLPPANADSMVLSKRFTQKPCAPDQVLIHVSEFYKDIDIERPNTNRTGMPALYRLYGVVPLQLYWTRSEQQNKLILIVMGKIAVWPLCCHLLLTGRNCNTPDSCWLTVGQQTQMFFKLWYLIRT